MALWHMFYAISLWHRRIRGDMIQVFKIINGIDDISCEKFF